MPPVVHRSARTFISATTLSSDTDTSFTPIRPGKMGSSTAWSAVTSVIDEFPGVGAVEAADADVADVLRREHADVHAHRVIRPLRLDQVVVGDAPALRAAHEADRFVAPLVALGSAFFHFDF